MAQFMPTFRKETATRDKIFYTTDLFDLQEEETASEEQKFAFIFICDRSGSMYGIRIEIVVEALQLFMQSLPAGCTFKILSFGSGYQSMFGRSMTEYNEDKKKLALQQIEEFDADLGCTELFPPT